LANNNLTRLKDAQSVVESNLTFVAGGPLHIEFMDALTRAIKSGGTNDTDNQQVQDIAELLFIEANTRKLLS
jgi:hypothetical protein